MLSVLCEGKVNTGKKDIVGKNWFFSYSGGRLDFIHYFRYRPTLFFFPENPRTKHVSEFLDFRKKMQYVQGGLEYKPIKILIF